MRESTIRFRRKAVAIAVATAMASSAYANPTGLSVVAGQATTQTIGNLMQVTNTPGAILNWQQFNVDVGQTTQFIQQNSASQVFNRVTGGDASQILGTLQSNGQVFLINPAGVFFGQGAVVDTAGFLASTLAASDTDLLNGHLRFKDSTGTAGAIVNQGTLKTHSGGSIVLLAPSVENSGIVYADGEVLLAAGHSVTIVDMKHPTIGLTVAVRESDKAVNLGQIISKNASLFSHLVKNSGVVEATGAQVDQSGVIRFVAKGDALVGGQVLAESASAKGGEIDITGNRVAVLDGARVSANGATGGGHVHVGGGWKGQDETIANARQTVVQANTVVSANATMKGNGGEVVVWADGHTVVNAEVQAMGGATGGNGGRIETSGKETLAVNVAANTSASNGSSGLWLIDPANLTIDSTGNGTFNLENSSSGPIFSTDDISATFSPTDSYLLASTVVSGLENNGFVEIYTTGSQPGEGNLTIAAPVLVAQNLSSPTGNNQKLFLQAQGQINIDAAVGLLPSQTGLNGFDLFLSYDIAKPIYVDAPLYLGNTGTLTLAPYEAVGGSVLPVNSAGQLPLDGVNFLSGANNTGLTGPLLLNRIQLSPAVATAPMTTNPPLYVGPNKPVKLNVLGANLRVNQIDASVSTNVPETELFVQGNLSYNSLNAKTLTVDAAGTVSTFTSFDTVNNFELSSNTNLQRLDSSGTANFKGGEHSFSDVVVNAGTVGFGSDAGASLSPFGFYTIQNLMTAQGATVNLTESSLTYGEATLNGTFNLLSGTNASPTFLYGVDTNLNGVLNIGSGNHFAYLKSLGMGSASEIQIGERGYLALGRHNPSNLAPVAILPKNANTLLSSTNGQFVADAGARIVMNGAPTSNVSGPPPTNQSSPIPPSTPIPPNGFFGGAQMDVTGLDGVLSTPIVIESSGYLNSIVTHIENEGESLVTPINTLAINSAEILVNAGGDGKALRIGQLDGNHSSASGGNTIPAFGRTIDLDFNGTLTVNSGHVLLEGATVSTTGGFLSVNGANSLIELSGKFTSADLYAINRTNAGRVAAQGLWDNSAVTLANASASAPLEKGDILVGDKLTIDGGLLTSAGTANSIKVTSDGFLELRNTEVTSTIHVAPEGVLMLAAQNESGVATAPVVLNKANVNMGGDALLIVEANQAGVADLNGTATVSSSHEGNLILAGRRIFNAMNTASAPDSMTLNVGSGIRLNVTGNNPSVPAGLQLYYSQRGTAAAPTRPVFLIGQLTPEAVAVVEYKDFNGFSTPSTTILSGFAAPSFVVDGTPDSAISPGAFNCTPDNACVKFDVAQNLTYSGSLRSTLGASGPTVANSGVSFVAGANLDALQFAFETLNEIQFIQGLNIVTAADLASGKTLVNSPGSIVRFGTNNSNENIANNLQNNGVLDLLGNYTFSGMLAGTGTFNNSGNLVLSNSTGTAIANSIVNTGTITNTGSYSLNGVLSGTGLLVNNGIFNFTGTGAAFQNSVLNTGSGVLNFSGPGFQFSNGFTNSSNVSFNGGNFSFLNGYTQSAGALTVQPGTTINGNLNINGGDLRGFATINGNLNVLGGRVVPGASPGLTTINGDLTLGSTSIVDIEIQGNGGVPGVDFDCIKVGGVANLDGQLNLIDLSGGTLTAGSQYVFLEAGTINGAFASVSSTPASQAYIFSPPVVNNLNSMFQMSTQTTGLAPPPVTTMVSTVNTDSVVAQNLDQAFVQPPASLPTSDQGTAQTNNAGTGTPASATQEEEDAVELANQSTAGTTISQQSTNIELKTTQSDPQRVSAVCK